MIMALMVMVMMVIMIVMMLLVIMVMVMAFCFPLSLVFYILSCFCCYNSYSPLILNGQVASVSRLAHKTVCLCL